MTRLSRPRRRGGNAVELALVMPVLTLLTFGGMDYAWYFIGYQEVQYATRSAARVGAEVPPTGGDPQSAARAALHTASEDGIVLPHLTLSVSTAIVNNASLRVEVTAAFSPIVGIVPVPGTIRIGTLRLLEYP